MSTIETNSLASYHDLARLDQLKYKAGSDPDGSLMEVARQFESIFLNMMLKSARETIEDGGIFNSPQLKTYQQMFDQQAAIEISSKGGIGLAEIIARQLDHTRGKPLIEPVEDREPLKSEGETVPDSVEISS